MNSGINAVAFVTDDNIVHWATWYDEWSKSIKSVCSMTFAANEASKDICLDDTQAWCLHCMRWVHRMRQQHWDLINGILCPWFDPILNVRVDGDCVKLGHGDHKAKVRPKQKPLYCQCLAQEDNNTYLQRGHTGTAECCSSFCHDCGIRECFECNCGEYDRYIPDDHFADEGGRSALRAATHGICPHHGCHKKVGKRDNYCKHCSGVLNPRKFACPTCGRKDVLTQADKDRGYQCDNCADIAEGRYGAEYRY